MNGNIFNMIEHRQSPIQPVSSVLDDRVAAEIMTHKILIVDSDWTLTQLDKFFRENKISGAPVTDASNRLVGVVSLTNIVTAQKANAIKGISAEGGDALEYVVADIMTSNVQSVTMNTPLKKVANIMVARNIHWVTVTHDKKVVGIISSLDMLRQELR